MSWTKRQFVEQAYEEIGYAGYVFDLEPEQLESAMRRMDAMLATWNAKGIRIGYPLPSSPQNSDLDDETNVPDSANEAIYINLAMRLSPPVGKTISAETRMVAKDSFNTLLMLAAVPPEMQLPNTMPAGSGNKPWRYDDAFLKDPADPLLAGGDGVIEFN